jgi:hypothetical protein
MVPQRFQTVLLLRVALAALLILFGAIAPTARLWLPEPVTCGMACCEASGVCYCQHNHKNESEATGEIARLLALAAKLNEVSVGRSCPAQCAQLPAGFQRHSITRAPPRFASVTGAVCRSFINTPYLVRNTLTVEAHAPRAPPVILF